MRPAVRLLRGAFALAAAGATSDCSRAPARPNVLLVSVDTLRADHLGCYGDAAAATPAMDRLAREGTLFRHAYSPLPLTLPAHATLLTGLEPPGHGLVDNGQSSPGLGVPTLAERLRPLGYDTAAFVSAFVLNRAFGLDRGFALYDDGPPDEAEVEGLFRRSAPAGERVEALIAWLARPRPGPFFAWLHLYDAHAPHVAPEPFALRYAGRPYDGEVAYVDSQLVRVLEFLDARGLARGTLVVLTADHGEGLGEHGEQTHGIFVYDSTLHVPLVLRWPGVLPAGRVDERPRALADVVPGVLALLGLPPDPRLEGRSLFDAAAGERALWAQSDYPQRQYGWAALRAVRRGRFKYVRAPRPELFDLATDAGETHDLSASRSDLVRELDSLLASLEQGLRRPGATPLREADEEQRARLAALGYVAGGPAADGAEAGLDPKDGLPRLAGVETAFEDLERGPAGAERAAQRLRELVARHPRNGQLALGLGRALELLGRPEEALAAYRSAAFHDDARLPALARLADLARARGDGADELEAAERLAAAFPRLSSAQRRLGEALARSGRPVEARVALERALQLDPASRRARLACGRFLREHGPAGEARAFGRRLAAELAGDDEARALAAQLEGQP